MRWRSYPATELVNDDSREPRGWRQPARMRQARRHIAFPCFPSARYRSGRKIAHLGVEIRGAALMHEVQDRHCRRTRLGQAPANLDVAAQCRWKLLAEQRNHAAEIVSPAQRDIGFGPRRFPPGRHVVLRD